MILRGKLSACSRAFGLVTGGAYLSLAVSVPLLAFSVARSGEVEGKVLNITQGGAPVPNAEVRLLEMRNDAPARTLVAGTDANGSFRFRGVGGQGVFYRLETTYAGQLQGSDPFPVSRDKVAQTLAVHDTTSSPEGISVEKIHLIVNPDANGVGITSIYIVQNWGGIFIGDPPTGEEQRRVGVRFLLPTKATDFQIMQGVLGAHHAITPWGFASTIPFYPGSDTLVFSYVIPRDGKVATFNIESTYKVASLSVIAMSGSADVTVAGGESKPTQMGMGMSQQLVNVGRSNIPPNTPVAIEVLPPEGGAGGASGGIVGSLSPGQWLMVIASIAFVAVILFTVYVRRKQSVSETPPGVEPPEARPAPVPGPSGPTEGTLEVDALVGRIADLDDAYEKGQLGEAEYVSRRRALKAELIKAVKAE